jgi:HlyD family secretion protein
MSATMTPAFLTRHSRSSIAAAAVLALVALSGCGDKSADKAATGVQSVRAVKTDYVRTQSLGGSLATPGLLVSREEAAVNAEINGYPVAKVLVDVGDQVKAGQPLVQLDDTLLRSQIDQAQAIYNQADIAAKQAAAQAQRVEGLDKSGALSQEAIDQRRFAGDTAKAQAAAQAASLKDLQTRASKMVVRAPVSGQIMARNVRPGDMSSAGGQPMFQIIRDNLVELEAQVPETSLATIKPGTGAQVILPDGRKINGQVRIIAPSVDANTKLGKVRIALPVEQGIRPGGYGQAVFNGSAMPVNAVPETALNYDADGVSLMVADQTNHVHKVKVTTGQRGGGYVELLTGPPPGSRVLLGASSFVLEGDLVKPVDVAAPQASAAGGIDDSREAVSAQPRPTPAHTSKTAAKK